MTSLLENNLQSINVELQELLGCCKSTNGLIDQYADNIGKRRDECFQRKANQLLNLARNTDIDEDLATNLVMTNREIRDISGEMNSLRDITVRMLLSADQTRRVAGLYAGLYTTNLFS